LRVVRQQALTVVAPITRGQEAASDAWLREHKRELQRALARAGSLHFARWVLLPPSLDVDGRSIGEQHLLAFETNFDGELQAHVADLRVALGALLDGAFAHVEGYPGSDELPALAQFFRDTSLRGGLLHRPWRPVGAGRAR